MRLGIVAVFLLVSSSALALDVSLLSDATIATRKACQNGSDVLGLIQSGGALSIDFAPSADQTCRLAAQSALAAFVASPPKVAGSATVTRTQALVALSRTGKLAQAQAWVNGQSTEVQLIWNSAPTFTRNSPLINSAANALGWTQADLDQLFITAATISP